MVASFPGYGVWDYANGWQQLTAANAAMVGIDSNGNVYGQFPGWGIWLDNAGAWQILTPNNPASIGVGGKSGAGL